MEQPRWWTDRGACPISTLARNPSRRIARGGRKAHPFGCEFRSPEIEWSDICRVKRDVLRFYELEPGFSVSSARSNRLISNGVGGRSLLSAAVCVNVGEN